MHSNFQIGPDLIVLFPMFFLHCFQSLQLTCYTSLWPAHTAGMPATPLQLASEASTVAELLIGFIATPASQALYQAR
ncbi:hypothetical protein BDA96_06G146100 [Sorghum bicolor]|uniref:Uncharacterized protein n=1 Tax=Sorghum bicolor TaxID=4558 RepID=A0A921QRG6_SORBI|nr:hypothetical protein BDA96_06G146100 [Sorghum bicolor]